MTKLEEVQRAICCPMGCRHTDTCGSFHYENKALAAIDALMEPSKTMIRTAATVLAERNMGDMHPDGWKCFAKDSTAVYQANLKAIKVENK